MRRPIVLLAAAMAAVVPASSADKPSDVRSYHLQWRDLANAVRDRRIELKLPSGIRLRGDAVAVGADALTLDVTGTSDRSAYPKGRAIVPRPEVTRLRVSRSRHLWRAVGTAIGAGIGAAIAIPIAKYGNNEGVDVGAICAAAVAVPAAVGFLVGWAADKGTVEIVIDPGPNPLKTGPF